MRAWGSALFHDDPGALVGAAWPDQTAALLRLAEGRINAVELGTGKAWTTVALALADPRRRIVSYDPKAWPTRQRYLDLAPRETRRRIELRASMAERGAAEGDRAVDFLFLDASHEEAETMASFKAWRPALTDDAVVAFHDYTNPDYPGVATAVERLGLQGETLCGMFVWRGSDQSDAGATAPTSR